MTENEIIKEVEKRVKKELEGKVDSDMLGYINIFENRKKKILEQEYGIKFQTIVEKNSSCSIDWGGLNNWSINHIGI